MAIVSILAAAAPAAGQGREIAIKGATVLTVTKGTIPNGTVVVRDGKIVAVGASVPIPPGAAVVDAAGRFLSPGLVDEHSHIASDSTNEGGTTVSSMTNVMDVLNPADVDIYRDLAGGLTVASVFHGSANPIGGTNTVIKLRWGKSRAEDLVFDGALPGLKFALGENPKDMRQFGQTGPRRYPASRPGVEFVIRDAFTRAKAYQRAWREYERRSQAGEAGLAPRRDLQLEPLVEVLEGRRLAHVHAYRADEMLMMLRLAEEFGFRVATFEHGLEGYKIAPELAAHGAGVGTFADWWGYKIEAIDAIPYNAALMMRAEVVVSINSDSAEHARRLNSEAAKMMKWGGLTEEEALALVTINPARQLKVDRRVGSIEVGKDADLVLWSHHPLSSYAIVERTYIDGTLYYERQADLARIEALSKEKAALIAAEGEGGAKADQGEAAKGAKAEVRKGDAGKGGRGKGEAAAASGAADGPASIRPPAATADEGDLARLAPKMTAGSLAKGTLAITNAKIVPVTRPAIERGTIVVRDGRIVALGESVDVPAGATVIDAAGAGVYPGWIDARTTVGLSEPGPRGFEDTSEMLDYNPQLRTVVAYHNDSEAIPVARANGVATVAVFPAGGLLGGQVPVMNLDGWTWEESTLTPIAGISFQFPGVGARRGSYGAPPAPERPYEELRK
ncbi:MAG TPA: amidohydrolase family protein, partial [Vicinamibacterales bacterium]|nr:amidohydrolase family protein [Vicinamibacterales bacterium]